MITHPQYQWSWTESNRRPSGCKPDALPTELQPRISMGPGGLEPPTSRLSGERSSRLSYEPNCLSPITTGHPVTDKSSYPFQRASQRHPLIAMSMRSRNISTTIKRVNSKIAFFLHLAKSFTLVQILAITVVKITQA